MTTTEVISVCLSVTSACLAIWSMSIAIRYYRDATRYKKLCETILASKVERDHQDICRAIAEGRVIPPRKIPSPPSPPENESMTRGAEP